jgi:hypothetical protein
MPNSHGPRGFLQLRVEPGELSSTLAQRCSRLHVQTIPAAEYAAITPMRDGRQYQTIACTGAVPLEVDQILYDTNEGRCLGALSSVELTHTVTPATDHRGHLSALQPAEQPA